MRTAFPLFQSHLDLAHSYWNQLLKPGDLVLDATCGNGQDTLKLAQNVLKNSSGTVWALDLQKEAIDSTRLLLTSKLSEKQQSCIHYYLGSHVQFPKEIDAESLSLIIYNLGYLPKGNKSITTLTDSTLTSLNHAIPLIKHGGAISITCYPGHAEGKEEAEALLAWCSKLDPKSWSCCSHRWENRKESPILIFIQKGLNH